MHKFLSSFGVSVLLCVGIAHAERLANDGPNHERVTAYLTEVRDAGRGALRVRLQLKCVANNAKLVEGAAVFQFYDLSKSDEPIREVQLSCSYQAPAISPEPDSKSRYKTIIFRDMTSAYFEENILPIAEVRKNSKDPIVITREAVCQKAGIPC